jgi:hypothetical protein
MVCESPVGLRASILPWVDVNRHAQCCSSVTWAEVGRGGAGSFGGVRAAVVFGLESRSTPQRFP